MSRYSASRDILYTTPPRESEGTEPADADADTEASGATAADD